jgi:hypothetical protein
MVLTVLLDIILPDGQTNKYIKGIFSVVVVMVIAAPVTGALNGGMNIEGLFDLSMSKYAADNNYIYGVYVDAYAKEGEAIKTYLSSKEGIEIEKADIVFDPADKQKILYMNIFLKKSVIEKNPAHINISDKIQETLSKRYSIKKEDVRILIW